MGREALAFEQQKAIRVAFFALMVRNTRGNRERYVTLVVAAAPR